MVEIKKRKSTALLRFDFSRAPHQAGIRDISTGNFCLTVKVVIERKALFARATANIQNLDAWLSFNIRASTVNTAAKAAVNINALGEIICCFESQFSS